MTAAAGGAVAVANGGTAASQHDVRLAARTERMRPSAIREILKLTDRGDVLSLAGGLPAAELFPVDAVADATQRALAANGVRALQYGPSAGLPELRAWVAERHALEDPDRVVVTSGSQQGLDLVGKILLDPGDRVALSAPAYMGALRAFDPYQPTYAPVAMDDEGLDPDALDAVLAEGASFLYAVPDFDNPSGRRAGLARREAILEVCAKHDVLVVEDAPYRELRFDDVEHPPLAALAPDRVVHLGSLSKTLAPGMRVAWMIVPDGLEEITEQAKQATDLHTGTFAQAVAYELVRDGALEARFPHLRTHYRDQRDRLTAALARHVGGRLTYEVPPGGMFLWGRFGDGVDANALLREAIDRGVAFVPGDAFYPGDGPPETVRLSFSLLDEAGFDEAARRLAAALDAYGA